MAGRPSRGRVGWWWRWARCAPSATAERQGAPIFAVLRHRDFALIWCGQLVSGLGDWLRNMALLFWVFSVTGGESPVATAAITVATTAPALLLGLTAGTLADRWERRSVMVFCDAARCVLSLLQLVAVAKQSLPLAYAVAFCSSAVEQLYDPARVALIRSTVPREDLVAASSLRQATTSAIMILGMALGTGIYFVLGPWVSFALDSASFLVAMCINLAIRARCVSVPSAQGTSVLREAKEGLAYVRGSVFVRSLLGLGALAMAASGLIEVVQLYLVTRELGLPEERLAWLGTTLGVSMFAGFAVAGSLHRRLRLEWLPGLGLGVCGLGVLLMAVAPTLAVAMGGMVFIGLGNVLLNVGLGPLMQTHVELGLLGRVMGVFRSVSTACLLLGASSAGYLIDLVDTRRITGLAGVILMVAALVAGTRLARAVTALRAAPRVEPPRAAVSVE
ncbi:MULTISPECIES: MFS transporter [unclassified Myxococcus]|uniref:MFS transporter n=1 Tax=Myxococcus TaxID=32 RepID=UPI001CBB7CD9|nr:MULTISPECIES: MFS transporter [unclassified Myxococcus]MBZ4400877.1 MFS transporter [Myxococcus sp. AS-1-15]MBZ4409440.1 MFS transporter [Myxococcus sp. XM-1-1-1]